MTCDYVCLYGIEIAIEPRPDLPIKATCESGGWGIDKIETDGKMDGAVLEVVIDTVAQPISTIEIGMTLQLSWPSSRGGKFVVNLVVAGIGKSSTGQYFVLADWGVNARSSYQCRTDWMSLLAGPQESNVSLSVSEIVVCMGGKWIHFPAQMFRDVVRWSANRALEDVSTGLLLAAEYKVAEVLLAAREIVGEIIHMPEYGEGQ